MIIDNGHAVVSNRKLFYILIVTVLVLLPVVLITNWFEGKTLGLQREMWALLISLLYVLFTVYRYLQQLTYIRYSDEGEKIIFKYYVLRTFTQKYKAIEIPKNQFMKYEIVRKLGITYNLYLYQRLGKKIAKYPPISLTALNHSEQTELIKSLNHIVVQNSKGAQ